MRTNVTERPQIPRCRRIEVRSRVTITKRNQEPLQRVCSCVEGSSCSSAGARLPEVPVAERPAFHADTTRPRVHAATPPRQKFVTSPVRYLTLEVERHRATASELPEIRRYACRSKRRRMNCRLPRVPAIGIPPVMVLPGEVTFECRARADTFTGQSRAHHSPRRCRHAECVIFRHQSLVRDATFECSSRP